MGHEGINLKINPAYTKEYRAMPNLKFEYEHFFLNAHLIRVLPSTHETTKQIQTEMMLGVFKQDWRIRELSERPGLFSFFGTFIFFSLHKEKKKEPKKKRNPDVRTAGVEVNPPIP